MHSTKADRPNGVCSVRSTSTPPANPRTAPFSGPATRAPTIVSSKMASGRTWSMWMFASRLPLMMNMTASTAGTLSAGVTIRDHSCAGRPLKDFHELQAAEVDGWCDLDVGLHSPWRGVHALDDAHRDALGVAPALQPRRHHLVALGHLALVIEEVEAQRLAGTVARGHGL